MWSKGLDVPDTQHVIVLTAHKINTTEAKKEPGWAEHITSSWRHYTPSGRRMLLARHGHVCNVQECFLVKEKASAYLPCAWLGEKLQGSSVYRHRPSGLCASRWWCQGVSSVRMLQMYAGGGEQALACGLLCCEHRSPPLQCIKAARVILAA